MKTLVIIAFALSCAATPLPGDDALAATNRTAEVALSPQVKVKVQAPEGWKLVAHDDMIYASRISGEALTLSFLLDDGKMSAQKALSDAVLAESAALSKEPQGQAVIVQEINSKSGHGAYVVFTTEGPLVAMHPTYFQMLCCRFATGKVIVKVWGTARNEMDASVKFISEGITEE